LHEATCCFDNQGQRAEVLVAQRLAREVHVDLHERTGGFWFRSFLKGACDGK
jgi:hypothetical protein